MKNALFEVELLMLRTVVLRTFSLEGRSLGKCLDIAHGENIFMWLIGVKNNLMAYNPSIT